MQVERTYRLPDDEALARLRALTDYWSAKYRVRAEWDGATARISGKVRGVGFDGTVTVRDGRLSADIKAGFLAEKLGGKLYVERKLDDYLDPSRTIAELAARVPR